MKGTGTVFMEKLKKAVAAGLILLIGLFTLTACSKTKQPEGPARSSDVTQAQVSRGPLNVEKVTYLVYIGGLPNVEMYIITPDLKVEKYDIRPLDYDKHYDYFEGELPPEDQYEITEYEITDLEWSSIVNVLTRVNFMELDEDMSTEELIDDGATYAIRVETTDSVNTSGGYMAGYDDNADSRRFAEAREMIENAIR